MNKILIIVFLTLLTSLNAVENKAYINIISNVQDTTIYLDGEEIGMTPIKQFEVEPNKKMSLLAVVDRDYYMKNIAQEIRINSNTIPTINLDFEKAMAKVFFIGDDAELYIDGKYIKKLHAENRIVTMEAGENVKIDLIDGDGKAHYIKDIKTKNINTLKYHLVRVPKAVRLYTSTINDLMWEDTKEATSTNINWNNAQLYCSNLKIADYDNFRLPSINELSELYDNKDDIYNGFGGKFYWSSSTFKDEYEVWDYGEVMNFENGLTQKSIKEFEQGRVRCVRDIDIDL
jgi:hypothetical protein